MSDENNNITIEFYKAYYNLFMTDNEKTFLISLVKIINKFNIIEFVSISHAKILINSMIDYYEFSYNICLFTYIKSDLVNKIMAYNGPNKFESLNNDIVNDVINFNNNLNNEVTYLNAFDKFPNMKKCIIGKNKCDDDFLGIDRLFDDKLEVNTKVNISNPFHEATMFEIVERFKLLTIHFGENVLLGMNLEKISVGEIFKMDCNKAIKYYNNVISKIKKHLLKYSNLCNAFIDIEQSYLWKIESFLTHSNKVYKGKYDIIITNENLE